MNSWWLPTLNSSMVTHSPWSRSRVNSRACCRSWRTFQASSLTSCPICSQEPFRPSKKRPKKTMRTSRCSILRILEGLLRESNCLTLWTLSTSTSCCLTSAISMRATWSRLWKLSSIWLSAMHLFSSNKTTTGSALTCSKWPSETWASLMKTCSLTHRLLIVMRNFATLSLRANCSSACQRICNLMLIRT